MAEIGSDDWLAAFDRAVRGIDAGDVEVRVLHRIEGGPAWVIEAAGGSVHVRGADGAEGGDGGDGGDGADGDRDAPPDLVFTWQRADAEAVAAGQSAPLAAFQAGRLRIGGDLRVLSEVAPLFARLPRVPAA